MQRKYTQINFGNLKLNRKSNQAFIFYKFIILVILRIVLVLIYFNLGKYVKMLVKSNDLDSTIENYF